MAEMALARWLSKQGWEELRSHIVTAGITATAPYAGAAVTLIAAYVSPGVPLPWLVTAAALTFMALSMGMFAFERASYDNNPEGKLRISGMNVAKRYEEIKLKRGREIEQRVAGIKYGFQYSNIGMFPMELEIKPVRISLGSSINPDPQRPVKETIAQIGTVGFWYEAEVPVTKEMRGKLIEGKFEVDIVYGRIGKRRRYVMERKFIVWIKFDLRGDIASFESTEVV